MDQNYFGLLSKISIKLKVIYDNPIIDCTEKEREIKECVKEVIDEHPNFGEQTKQDLKNFIEFAPSEKIMFEEIATYMALHNCIN